ncbi:hypothetical protein EJ02DRAFT_504340 [Clathrospora elynae]|uniref:Uncharacterized protein n=1 Tax=Clathrospora elynae TaxID=706981 RepID=A0A6A5SHL0_9PLEO|nr:hypothetical protein EJ02DRAFT_504340 [Clathrospora elynae]
MVSFRILFASALAITASIAAKSEPAQIVEDLNTLTQKSKALMTPVSSVSTVNGPLIIIGRGPFPKIIRGFTDIVSNATTYIDQISKMADVAAGAPSNDVFDAYRKFASTHQTLLDLLTSKAELFNTVPLIGEPVAAVLRQDEKVIDTLTFALISKVLSYGAEIGKQAEPLDKALTTCIEAYKGLSLKKRSLRFARREIEA